jgi:hypothetical protein
MFSSYVRNPFDNIATMKNRGSIKMDLQHYIDYYFELCELNRKIIKAVGEAKVLTLWHESLVKNPQKSIKEICSFLNLEALKKYVDDCSAIVF